MTGGIVTSCNDGAASVAGRGVTLPVTHDREDEQRELVADTTRHAVAGPLSIHLLGTPRVTRGQHQRPAPRGRKAWALLAYILATDSTPSREWLAALLFSDADDPLNALSWSLSQLRRL